MRAAIDALPAEADDALSTVRLRASLSVPGSMLHNIAVLDEAWKNALRSYASAMNGIQYYAAIHRSTQDAIISGERDAQRALSREVSDATRWTLENTIREAPARLSAATSSLTRLDDERRGQDSRTSAQLESLIWQYMATGTALPPPPRVSTGVTVTAIIDGVSRTVSATDIAGLLDPGIIAEVWASLDPESRQRLLGDNPLLLGNLEGIALRDRNTANRITAGEYRNQLERELTYLTSASPAHPGQYDGEIERRETEIRTLDAILGDRNERYAGERVGDESFGIFRIFAEDGTRVSQNGLRLVSFNPLLDAIITYQGALDPITGDIAPWVQNVGTFIPGSNSRLGGFEGNADRSRNMYNISGPASGYFTYQGSALPDIDNSDVGFLEAAKRSYAEDGAPRMLSFLNGVRLPPGAALVPIAHSYGAVVLARAESLGLRADRIVYVAPAGLGHDTSLRDGLDAFPHTGDKPHFLLQARNDRVVGFTQGGVSGFGLGHGFNNPLAVPGITRLETGFIDKRDPALGSVERGGDESHSDVLGPYSTSLENIANVVSGKPVSVYQPDDFLAPNLLTQPGPYSPPSVAPDTGVKKPPKFISPLDLEPLSRKPRSR